jgi:1,4-alpha-glucan branching enzyme
LQQFANLRALFGWMYAYPGKKLLFMGGEFGQDAEWAHDRSLDWHLLQYAEHLGLQRLVRDLGALYRDPGMPSLWQRDHTSDGFGWIDAGDAPQNVFSFVRRDAGGRPGLLCVANFSPMVRRDYRVGVPLPGRWREVLNTDSTVYGGSNQGNLGALAADPVAWHGQPQSVRMTLPPLAVVWFVPES